MATSFQTQGEDGGESVRACVRSCDKHEGLICVRVEVGAHQSQPEDMQGDKEVHTGDAGVSCLSVAAVRPGGHHRLSLSTALPFTKATGVKTRCLSGPFSQSPDDPSSTRPASMKNK